MTDNRAEKFRIALQRSRDFLVEMATRIRDARNQYPKLFGVYSRGQSFWKRMIERYGSDFLMTVGTIVMSTYFLSDLTTIIVQKFMPETADTESKIDSVFNPNQNRPMLSDYEIIISRNLVNSKGLIPEEGSDQQGPASGIPVKTSLPFDLIGTMILEERERSLATIQDRSQDKVFPVIVGDEIPGKARITEIQAFKVIFINVSTNRNEYVELPQEESAIRPAYSTAAAPVNDGVNKLSATRVVVSRTKLEATMKDLNKVLTEARVVPAPGGGFKIFQIVKGSIYDELNLKDGDILVSVGGNPIDASKAFGMLNELTDTKHIDLGVKRGGQSMSFSYDIE